MCRRWANVSPTVECYLGCNRWHQPQLDLFAMRFNNKLPQFVLLPSLGSCCTQPAMGVSGHICLSNNSHPRQSACAGTTRLPLQKNLSSVPAQPGQSTDSTIQLRNLSDLNLHAWLLEPQLSRSKGSLMQWQHKLRLLKEAQLDQSMKQRGPFLQSGATVIR